MSSPNRIAELQETGKGGLLQPPALAPDFYRALVEDAPEAVGVIQAGRILFANQRITQLTGLLPNEIAGLPLTEVVHAEDVAYVVSTHQRRLLGLPTPDPYVARLRHKAGNFRWVEIHVSLISWNGAPATLNFYTDITERRLLETRTRETSELLQFVLDAAPQYISWRDRALRFLGCNASYARMAGLTGPQEIIGKTDRDLPWPKEQTDFYQAQDQRVMETGQPVRRLLEPGTNAVGQHRWLETTKLPLHDQAGQIIGILSFSEDITERKRAEDELRQSEERFRLLFETLTQGVVYQDQTGQILSVNPAAEQILGATAQELQGRTSADARWQARREDGSPLPGPEHPAMIALRTGQTVQGVIIQVFNPRRNEHRWIQVDAVPERTPDAAEPFRVYTTFSDITEAKRAEQERQSLQAQLMHAQKMESIGRLAGGVAHDFNNMLQSILGNVLLAQEQVEPGSQLAEDLREIQQSAERSAALTKQLLGFASKQVVAPRVLDLNDTISGLLRMLQRLIGENVQLSWRPGKDSWLVCVDPGQVDQILTNLVVNSRDAISGTGEIQIATANVVLPPSRQGEDAIAAGEYVLITVRDTGSGLSADAKAHLFEPFFTTKALGKGTGLGLATVFGIVRQNQGRIEVTSEPGAGTTVAIWLPRATGPAAATAPPTPAATAVERRTVLLVEDEEQILKLARRVLSQQGYTVLAAHSPAEAIALVGQKPPALDLLITDIIMPGMSGRELRNHLLPCFPSLPTVFMSGYDEDDIGASEPDEPRTGFLQKPFTITDFLGTVQQVLREAGQQA